MRPYIDPQRLDDLVSAMMEESHLLLSDKENIAHADSFLQRARRDIVNCKDAYRRKDWAESVYKLQQAGEKGTKAYLLYTGLADHKELRNAVGHNAMRGFTLLFDRTESLRKKGHLDELVKGIFPWAKTDTSLLKEQAKKKPYQMMDLINLDYGQIRQILHGLDRDLKQIEIRWQMAQGMIDDDLLRQATTIVDARLRSQGGVTISLEQVKAELKRTLGMGHAHLGILYTVAVIASPHEDFTRYPDDHGNGVSWSDYTKEMGIVRAVPDLRKRLSAAIDFIYENWGASERTSDNI